MSFHSTQAEAWVAQVSLQRHGELMADLVKYADSEDERSGKGKKSNGMKGQQYNSTNEGGNGKCKADDFVANTDT